MKSVMKGGKGELSSDIAPKSPPQEVIPEAYMLSAYNRIKIKQHETI